MHSLRTAPGSRLCPSCGAGEAIGANEPIWPAGWRCHGCGYAVPVVDGIPHFAPALAGTLTGFDPAAFDRLARSEEGHYWFEPRNRLLVGLADKFFPTARSYMEIGCGTGAVLTAMANSRSWSRLVGSELHPSGLVHARQRLGGRSEFVQMDARSIPALAAFDFIGAFDVIEHIEEDAVVLRQAFAALAAGGGFLAAVPQHPALWSHIDEMSHHVRRYRRGELEGKLRDTGFEILFSTSYAAIVLPLMAVSRVFARRSGGDAEARVRLELDAPRLANAGLRSLLHTEVWLTLKGLRWPAGGSRVVVARKPFAA